MLCVWWRQSQYEASHKQVCPTNFPHYENIFVQVKTSGPFWSSLPHFQYILFCTSQTHKLITPIVLGLCMSIQNQWDVVIHVLQISHLYWPKYHQYRLKWTGEWTDLMVSTMAFKIAGATLSPSRTCQAVPPPLINDCLKWAQWSMHTYLLVCIVKIEHRNIESSFSAILSIFSTNICMSHAWINMLV